MIDGKNYRTVTEQCWSTTRRLADLPGMDLELQAISPMPELLSYWLEPAAGAQLARYLNEQIAQMVSESSGHLVGLGAVPLQDIDAAIKELYYMCHSLGMRGVELGSNINGTVIGSNVFDPFFQACVDLDMPIFVHALKPAGMDRLLGPAPLQQVLGYPTDVGLAAASVITSNLMDRFPKLRIAFSHGGGTLAMMLPRLQHAMSVFPALQDTVHRPPVEQARQLFYDTLVFDARTLQHLIGTFGASQLMIGTDYPFNFHESHPVQRLLDAGLERDVIDQITHTNAKKFLGIELH
jgi:aminocarboxymuconate-semialdehyde decarboxylase